MRVYQPGATPPSRFVYENFILAPLKALKYVHRADERFTVLNSGEYFGKIFRYRVSHCNSTREYQSVTLACGT